MQPTPADPFVCLLAAAQQGDATAREHLLVRVLPRLRGFVRLHAGAELRSRESCSDLVQTVCRELLLDLSTFRGTSEAAFQGWLGKLALRKLLEKQRFHAALRRDGKREERLATESDGALLACYGRVATPSQAAEAREEIARVERAFDRLPADYRDVLVHACVLEEPHREIAARLGRSEEAVRQLLARARARLATVLAEA